MASLGKQVFAAIKAVHAKGGSREDIIEALNNVGAKPAHHSAYMSYARKAGMDIAKAKVGRKALNREKLAELISEGKTNAEAAQAIGATKGTIRNLRAKLPEGVKLPSKGRASPMKARAVQMIEAGHNNTEISKALEISKEQAQQYRYRHKRGSSDA